MVSQDAKDSVTMCAHCGVRPAVKKFCGPECRKASRRKVFVKIPCKECGKEFLPTSSVNTCCSDACRQAAYRKSPAHRAYLDKQKNRRALRRAEWFRRRNRDKHLTPLSRRSGPDVSGVPPVGQLRLPDISA